MTKRTSIALFATVVMTGAALAADLPVYGPRAAPFIVQQAVEWSGFYFGANAGYGLGKQASNTVFTGSSSSGLTNPITGLSLFGTSVLVPGPTELSGTRVNGSAGVRWRHRRRAGRLQLAGGDVRLWGRNRWPVVGTGGHFYCRLRGRLHRNAKRKAKIDCDRSRQARFNV